jgi:hypothetical protein
MKKIISIIAKTLLLIRMMMTMLVYSASPTIMPARKKTTSLKKRAIS